MKRLRLEDLTVGQQVSIDTENMLDFTALSARILAIDLKGKYPIALAVTQRDVSEEIIKANKNGETSDNRFIYAVPEYYETWLVVIKLPSGVLTCHTASTEEEAEKLSKLWNHVKTIKVKEQI